MHYAWPYSRTNAAAQFLCQLYQWPSYEFFMTQAGASAARALGKMRLEKQVKRQVLLPHLLPALDQPINPRGSGTDWLSFDVALKTADAGVIEKLEKLELEGKARFSHETRRDVGQPSRRHLDIQIAWANRCASQQVS